MADYLTNLMLSKDTLPQLSDEHLTLLSNSQEYQNSVHLDDFDLNCLDDFNLNNQSFIQQSNYEFYIDQQINPKFNTNLFNYDLNSNQLHSSNFSSKQSASFTVEQPQNFINQNCTSLNNVVYSNDHLDQFISNNQASINQMNYSSSFLNNHGSTEFSNSNLNNIEFNDITGLDDSNQSFYSNQFIQTDYDNQSGYLNQTFNSSIDNSPVSQTKIDSPVTIDFSSQIHNSPSIDYSNQTLNSPSDYSIQSVNSTYAYSSSLTNSPQSSESSYESHDYTQDFLNYSNSTYSNSSYSQFSITDSYSVPSQYNNILNSNQPEFNETNEQQIKITKRKKTKKAISEEEIRRKLEIKLERRRKRLERKKVQNKEAAKRYREKKKFEEDQINQSLLNVKDNFKNLRDQLKETLNEKKVLVKLLKDFAGQSNDILIPEWMNCPSFLTSLIK